AERDGVFKTGFAQTFGGDLSGQVDGTHRVDGGLQAQMIGPFGEVHRAPANGFSFRGDLDGGARRAGRFESDFDGEALPAEYLAGQRYGFQNETRFGAAAEHNRVHRDPELLRLPDAARHAPQV